MASTALPHCGSALKQQIARIQPHYFNPSGTAPRQLYHRSRQLYHYHSSRQLHGSSTTTAALDSSGQLYHSSRQLSTTPRGVARHVHAAEVQSRLGGSVGGSPESPSPSIPLCGGRCGAPRRPSACESAVERLVDQEDEEVAAYVAAYQGVIKTDVGVVRFNNSLGTCGSPHVVTEKGRAPSVPNGVYVCCETPNAPHGRERIVVRAPHRRDDRAPTRSQNVPHSRAWRELRPFEMGRGQRSRGARGTRAVRRRASSWRRTWLAAARRATGTCRTPCPPARPSRCVRRRSAERLRAR